MCNTSLSVGIIGIYTVRYSDSRSVSQNQIRQGEHDIQFSGLFSQTFVPVSYTHLTLPTT